MTRRPTLTTSAGAPVGDNQNMLTAGPHGPALLQDYQLIEKLAHQNRESFQADLFSAIENGDFPKWKLLFRSCRKPMSASTGTTRST